MRKAYDDLDLTIDMGKLRIKILYLRFVPPSPGKHIKNHCHMSYELHFIPYGRGTLIADGVSYAVEPGTLFLTGPQVYHEQISDLHDPMAECCINFDVTLLKKAKWKENIPEMEIDEIARTLFETRFWFDRDEHRCIELFEKIADELDRQYIGYCYNIRNYVSQIIINTVRCYSRHKKAAYPIPRRTLDEKREQILDRLLIKDKNLSLTRLANELGVSARQLRRIIQRHYNTNFKKKQLGDRMERAKMYILNSDMSIEEIADKVGFSSSSYFCKIFKKNTGFTPTQYRKNFEKKDHLV